MGFLSTTNVILLLWRRIRTDPLSSSQARTLTRLFERYQWKEVAVLYYAVRSDVIPRCALIMDDLEVLFASENY